LRELSAFKILPAYFKHGRRVRNQYERTDHFASLAPLRELSALKIRPALFHAQAQSNATSTKDIGHFASSAPLLELSAFKVLPAYFTQRRKARNPRILR